jgi:hypothetical protein
MTIILGSVTRGHSQNQARFFRRLVPTCEHLVAICGSLPTTTASLVASLDLLPVAAPKSSSIAGSRTNSSKQAHHSDIPDALGSLGSSNSSHARFPNGRARNVRLETVMASSRCVEVQVCMLWAVSVPFCSHAVAPESYPITTLHAICDMRKITGGCTQQHHVQAAIALLRKQTPGHAKLYTRSDGAFGWPVGCLASQPPQGKRVK